MDKPCDWPSMWAPARRSQLGCPGPVSGWAVWRRGVAEEVRGLRGVSAGYLLLSEGVVH